MVKLILSFVLFFLCVLNLSIYPTAVCVGYECQFISNQTIIGANLVEPALGEIYTKDFLATMGQSAVFQNINSSMLGGTWIEKNRIGLGYSMSRSNLKAREFYFASTELRTLPTQGVAAAPSFSYAFNLGHIFTKTGEWRKWNIFVQFFPYYLSENNIPLLKIKNTEVGGKVLNMSFNARYFPFVGQESNPDSLKNGLSFGIGLFQTSQEVQLNSYDRRPTQFQVDGDRRRWIGINQFKYESNIYSGTTDFRYSYGGSGFSLFGGLGFLYSQGKTRLKSERYALISSMINRDDFGTSPSAIGLDLTREHRVNNSDFYGVIGFQYRFSQTGVGLEYLKNRNTESLNLGIHYYF